MTSPEPFHIEVPEADLADLRRRLSAARWPTQETVSDWSQGVPLEVLREVVNIGGRRTTGGQQSGVSTSCLTTEPRSTESRYISFICAPRLPMLFR